MNNEIRSDDQHTNNRKSRDDTDNICREFINQGSHDTQDQGGTKVDEHRLLLFPIPPTGDKSFCVHRIQKTSNKSHKDTSQYHSTFFKEQLDHTIDITLTSLKVDERSVLKR